MKSFLELMFKRFQDYWPIWVRIVFGLSTLPLNTYIVFVIPEVVTLEVLSVSVQMKRSTAADCACFVCVSRFTEA